jgi:hypothetical protein
VLWGSGGSTVGAGVAGRSDAGTVIGKQTGIGAASEKGNEVDIASGPAVSEELAKLLISTHKKPFPSVQSILDGYQVGRELTGVPASGLPCAFGNKVTYD